MPRLSRRVVRTPPAADQGSPASLRLAAGARKSRAPGSAPRRHKTACPARRGPGTRQGVREADREVATSARRQSVPRLTSRCGTGSIATPVPISTRAIRGGSWAHATLRVALVSPPEPRTPSYEDRAPGCGARGTGAELEGRAPELHVGRPLAGRRLHRGPALA